jgi:hypothetical protein
MMGKKACGTKAGLFFSVRAAVYGGLISLQLVSEGGLVYCITYFLRSVNIYRREVHSFM